MRGDRGSNKGIDTTAAGWDADRWEFLTLKSDILATQFLVKALILREALRKANFNPNQPRKPAGQPDGGEWTDGGGYSDFVYGYQGGNDGGSGDEEPIETPPPRPRLHIEIWPATGRPPIEEQPPVIPKAKPSRFGTQLRYARLAARWIGYAARVAAPGPGTLFAIAAEIGLEFIPWLYEEYEPYISAYLESPKTLAERQRDVATQRRGTEVHHIVEQKAAEAAGFPRSQIDAPEILVRISTFKHWQISGFYSRKSKIEKITPREYLKDKTWEERREFGIQTMIREGIILP